MLRANINDDCLFPPRINGPGWIRTSEGSRQRVYSPSPENGKNSNNKDLEQGQSGDYKPAYKQNSKMAENQPKMDTSKLPPDLAEIAAAWPELPEHIKQAIKSLVEAAKNCEKQD